MGFKDAGKPLILAIGCASATPALTRCMTSCDITGAAAKPCQASPEELCARFPTLRSSITKSRRLAVRRFPSDSLNGCQPYLQRAAEGVGLSRRPSYLTKRVASSPHPHGRLRANPAGAGLVYK